MKKSVGRPFYALSFSLLGVVVLLTLLPIVWPTARAIYEPAVLSVVFALLSLAVSMIIFGVIGDSAALVKAQAPNGLSVQIAGSAAGFVVFYYLLSSGLAPYSSLVMYLYKEPNKLVEQGDGPIEVTIAGRVRRSDFVSNGQVTFSFLPKTEDRKILIPGSQWAIASISPRSCVNAEGLVLSSCDKVDVQLARAESCLTATKLVVQDIAAAETTLNTLLPNLRDDFQKSIGTAVSLNFSARVLSTSLHLTKFSIHRRDGTVKNACGHLNVVAETFNRAQNKNILNISTSCTGIYISEASELVPKEYTTCGK